MSPDISREHMMSSDSVHVYVLWKAVVFFCVAIVEGCSCGEPYDEESEIGRLV